MSKGEKLIEKPLAKLVHETVHKAKPAAKKFIPKTLNSQSEQILQKYSTAGQNFLTNSGKQILNKYLIGSGIVFD